MKPQDILVLLKLLITRGRNVPYSKFAKDIFISTSELHASIKRLVKSGLLSPDSHEVIVFAMKEFLFHGIKYVFPADIGAITRGVPTSVGVPPLKDELISIDSEIPVWPDSNGTHRGVSFEPLYKSVPAAAKNDENLYRLLALVDSLRSGRARERKLAEQLFEKEIDIHAAD